jgi:hypothetical protein
MDFVISSRVPHSCVRRVGPMYCGWQVLPGTGTRLTLGFQFHLLAARPPILFRVLFRRRFSSPEPSAMLGKTSTSRCAASWAYHRRTPRGRRHRAVSQHRSSSEYLTILGTEIAWTSLGRAGLLSRGLFLTIVTSPSAQHGHLGGLRSAHLRPVAGRTTFSETVSFLRRRV